MKIIEGKEQEYQDWKNKNTDAYGRECFEYAERWANMLEEQIEKENNPENVIFTYASKYSSDADINGITGFMYGCVVQILSLSWKYGEYLRKWHNKEYDYNGDGVVNPAIITIKEEQ